MSTTFRFLHVSDIHASAALRDRLKAKVAALFADIEILGADFDAIFLTGDIAATGKQAEHEIAQEVVIEPLCRRLRVAEAKVFIIPGNHDVDRGRIATYEDEGMRAVLKDTDAAGKAFDTLKAKPGRLTDYFVFFSNRLSKPGVPFGVHRISFGRADLGIACLNSAWRCASDKDEGRLFLTDLQVTSAADQLADCALRIALVHHPLDWYHKADAEVLEQLKRRFEIILTGHLHAQVSVAEQTTSSNSLLLTVPALMGEKKDTHGYNIYTINLEDRTLTADFRKYVRKRNEFDRDTVHARDGRHVFTLPVRNISSVTKAVTVQRLTSCKTRIQQTIKNQLMLIQKVQSPVLVTPKIQKVSFSGDTRIKTPVRGSLLEIAKTSAVVFGPTDSGKTILLQSLTADLNDSFANEDPNRFALYIDLEGAHDIHDGNAAVGFLDSAVKAEFPGQEFRNFVILADNVTEKNSVMVQHLENACVERNSILVVTVRSPLLFETLAKTEPFQKSDFYELGHWGPSRIREFITKYFAGTSIDADAAYNFVKASLEDTDLPATPWIVSLYLSIFPALGDQVTSLSFVRLLEKIEEDRLGKVETSSSDSLYNKREILMRVAVECLNRGAINLERSFLEAIVTDFFKERFLPVNSTVFVNSLIESGILITAGESIRFSYFAFYDYFLARAFERGVIKVEDATKTLHTCAGIGQALALYGGIIRENATIAKTVLDFVAVAFNENKNFTLKDLECYIKDLMAPDEKGKSPDQVATRDLRRKIEYEEFDEEFQKRKDAQTAARSSKLLPGAPTSNLEQLGLAIRILKTFYNVFRNLENIPGKQKIEFLEEVLDFHISCTLRLIKFFHGLKDDADSDFKSLVAYIVTLGGQGFLATNIGSQSLREAILATLDVCQNDLKRLLLVCLYADLRLQGYANKLQDYVETSRSIAAVELIYLQTRRLLITHDSLHMPVSLLGAFQAAFKKRHALLGDQSTKGAYQKAYNADLDQIQKAHLSFINARDELIQANQYT